MYYGAQKKNVESLLSHSRFFNSLTFSGVIWNNMTFSMKTLDQIFEIWKRWKYIQVKCPCEISLTRSALKNNYWNCYILSHFTRSRKIWGKLNDKSSSMMDILKSTSHRRGAPSKTPNFICHLVSPRGCGSCMSSIWKYICNIRIYDM